LGYLIIEGADSLPKPSLIPEPAKTADMIRISCPGLCGEEDFRYLWEEKARTPRVNERNSAGQQAIIEGYIAKGHIQVKLV
jgi:hypothetical protein